MMVFFLCGFGLWWQDFCLWMTQWCALLNGVLLFKKIVRGKKLHQYGLMHGYVFIRCQDEFGHLFFAIGVNITPSSEARKQTAITLRFMIHDGVILPPAFANQWFFRLINEDDKALFIHWVNSLDKNSDENGQEQVGVA